METIVEYSESIIKRCAEVGTFLESDYRRAILQNSIPKDTPLSFAGTGTYVLTKVVIVGAYSVPMVTVRAVLLAALNGNVKEIDVKCPSPDEAILVESLCRKWLDGLHVKCTIHAFQSSNPTEDWLRAVEEATHIIVYGSNETVRTFELNRKPWQRVIGFGSKFSIGIIAANTNYAKDVVSDFTMYYGAGCLSPRRYYVIGEQLEFSKFVRSIDEEYQYYRSQLREYWAKNQIAILTKRGLNKVLYGREDIALTEYNTSLSDSLSGTADVCRISNTRDSINGMFKELQKYRGLISTIALTSETKDYMFRDELKEVVRICSPGQMQLPDFMHRHDGENELQMNSVPREVSL